jgi:predicted anti-sigma-YlaC factor YlaD
VLSCREIVDLVTEYLEGTMAAADRVAFERHIAICPPCRGYLAQMRGLLRAAGTLHEEDLPPELRAALLEHFASWQRQQPV